MLQIRIVPKGNSYHQDKIHYTCPDCGKEDFYIGWQTKMCTGCKKQLPDINILIGKNGMSTAKRFFEELNKC